MQEPNENNELRDEILGGEYNAPARPGMINPDKQMNWSLGLPAEQSEAIEVMIINDAGDAERMGLISALFALSQGDKVEDARQELAIVLGYKEADKTIRIDMANFHRETETPSYESWVGESLPTKAEIADEFGEHPSAFECDGERTEFKPGKAYKGDFIVFVNGVETSFINDGFSVTLDRAPETGSDVKFIGTSSYIDERIKAVKEVIALTTEAADGAAASYAETIKDLKTEDDALRTKQAELEAEIEALKDAEKEATVLYEEAKKSAYEGNSVDEVEAGGKEAQEKLMDLEKSNKEVDSAEHSLENTNIAIEAVVAAVNESNTHKAKYDDNLTQVLSEYDAELTALEEDKVKYDQFGNQDGE